MFFFNNFFIYVFIFAYNSSEKLQLQFFKEYNWSILVIIICQPNTILFKSLGSVKHFFNVFNVSVLLKFKIIISILIYLNM